MHPEHFELSQPLFLPVTDETCASLLGADGARVLTTLTNTELAAVLVIQNLAVAAETELTAHASERILAKLIAWAADAQHSAPSGLLSEAQRLFDQRKLYFGRKVMKALNLRFLLADDVLARDYLLPDGEWDVGFKIRHYRGNNPFSAQMVTPRHRELWLSPAQDKLVRTFRANLDEHLHVQGYAGIGKSHLLGALIEHLKPEATLLLAHTPSKLAALRKRMGSASGRRAGLTFLEFAKLLLGASAPQPASKPTRAPSLAQELNILGVCGYDAQATLAICLKILEQYCYSRDNSLSVKHLPRFRQALSNLDAKVLLQYSSRLWAYLQSNPVWGSNADFEALLLIKRACLEGRLVPARYTHVLIDESQDVPLSLLKIIERGRQVLITLGDEYQQAKGTLLERKRDVRHSEISYSVRSGRNIERLVNPLIYRHSNKSKAPFEGANDTDVGIEHYPLGFVPPEGCVVLTASHWDTMKWVIEMNDANSALRFPTPEAKDDLTRFMTTAVALFKSNYYSVGPGTVGLHPHFTEMSDWKQVHEANQFDESFLWVEAQLNKGFNVADITRLTRVFGQHGKSCMIMQAEEAGGMEFNQVLLTPGLLTTVMFRDAYEFDQRICAVYIALSRAKRQLYIPYDVVEWIDFHSSQKFRELSGY